jgi:hypothetical protein
MAIISCPSCKKNISSLTVLCLYCGFQRGEVAEEQLIESHRRKLRDRIYHLKMSSYAALFLLIVAFGWFLSATSNFQKMSPNGPYILFGVGVSCYLVIRVYLHKARRAIKKLSA